MNDQNRDHPTRWTPCEECDGQGYGYTYTGEAPNQGGGPTCSPTEREVPCEACRGRGYMPIEWHEEGYEDALEELPA